MKFVALYVSEFTPLSSVQPLLGRKPLLNGLSLRRRWAKSRDETFRYHPGLRRTHMPVRSDHRNSRHSKRGTVPVAAIARAGCFYRNVASADDDTRDRKHARSLRNSQQFRLFAGGCQGLDYFISPRYAQPVVLAEHRIEGILPEVVSLEARIEPQRNIGLFDRHWSSVGIPQPSQLQHRIA